MSVRRPCLEPGCGAEAGDGPRCPAHQRRKKAAYRDPRYKRFRREVQAGMWGPCVDCGTWDELTVDHRVPVSAGGGNSFDNLVVRCRRHNRAKGAETR